MGRICVDGFPRSGNTFLQEVLNHSFPQALVEPFTHSAKVLTQDHFVVIRDPGVSISSFMSVFREPDADASERWWLRFHNVVLKKTEPKRWIFFDELIKNPEQVINRIGMIVETDPLPLNYTHISKNAAPEPYPLHLFDKAQELYCYLREKATKG